MRISDWSSDVCSSDLLGSFNILWAAVHEWVGIAKDVWNAPWKHKLSYMWREPGWSHDGSRETSAMLRERWVEGRQLEAAAASAAPSRSLARPDRTRDREGKSGSGPGDYGWTRL